MSMRTAARTWVLSLCATGNTGDTGIPADDVVPFVDPAQQDLAEVDRPDAIGGLLKADGELLEGLGNEHKPLPDPDCPGVGDALEDEVAGTLDWRQDGRMVATLWRGFSKGHGPRGSRRAPFG